MAIAQLSSKSVEHYTPAEICDRARRVFDDAIELDPFSCRQANQIVQAERIFTIEDDAFCLPWRARTAFVNPPGGSVPGPDGRAVNAGGYAWALLAQRHDAGDVRQALFVVFNLETLRFAQRWQVRQPLDFASCFPRERLDFLRPSPAGPIPQGSPAHPSAFIYLGPREGAFLHCFGALGYVRGAMR